MWQRASIGRLKRWQFAAFVIALVGALVFRRPARAADLVASIGPATQANDIELIEASSSATDCLSGWAPTLGVAARLRISVDPGPSVAARVYGGWGPYRDKLAAAGVGWRGRSRFGDIELLVERGGHLVSHLARDGFLTDAGDNPSVALPFWAGTVAVTRPGWSLVAFVGRDLESQAVRTSWTGLLGSQSSATYRIGGWFGGVALGIFQHEDQENPPGAPVPTAP